MGLVLFCEALNRTILELKRKAKLDDAFAIEPLNRTILELKQIRERRYNRHEAFS